MLFLQHGEEGLLSACRILLWSHHWESAGQGALERMSEEPNVGGLLSYGSEEVCIYNTSVGLGLAEEKQFEWVDSAVVPQGEARGKAEKKKV